MTRTVMLAAVLSGVALEGEQLTAGRIGELAAAADRAAMASVTDYSVVQHVVVDAPRMKKHSEMVVKVVYRNGEISHQILKTVNAEGMQKKIFERLLEAEKESAKLADQMRVGPANYNFELVGTETKNGRPCYVLDLQPKRKSKYLVAGKAWVAQDDFGVVQIEGRPAGSVSFWVSRTQLDQTFCKVGPVWMMARNHSTADVKIVGKSTLFIDSSSFNVTYRQHDQLAKATFEGFRNALPAGEMASADSPR